MEISDHIVSNGIAGGEVTGKGVAGDAITTCSNECGIAAMISPVIRSGIALAVST